MSTECPKLGAAQWTCTYEECTCHVKETIPGRALLKLADIGRDLEKKKNDQTSS